MEGGVSDSLDLIPIGAWNGNGRKAKFWSPILLGMWDPSSGCAVAVCKCMSGMLLYTCLIWPSSLAFRIH